MSPVERLEAAITKLETLKAESTPGEWRASEIVTGHWFVIAVEGSVGESVAALSANDGSGEGPTNGELIVALHRTIDAQLAILRHARRWWGHEERVAGTDRAIGKLWQAFALADAILGGA